MRNFDYAFDIVAGPNVEGGLSMDPQDRGNWTGGEVGKGTLKGTNRGISAARYPDEDIANLTSDRVKFLYNRDYWQPYKLDTVEWGKALIIFDSAVNGGKMSQWLVRHNAKMLEQFVVDWQTDHMLYLAGLPQWPHDRGGWVKRLFFITTQALRSPT
jgi:lysozyme family protein